MISNKFRGKRTYASCSVSAGATSDVAVQCFCRRDGGTSWEKASYISQIPSDLGCDWTEYASSIIFSLSLTFKAYLHDI